MRFAILFLLGAAALPAAGSDPLVKVGDYHLKTARYGAAVVADGGSVYVLGGANDTELLGDIERFDISTHEVVRVTDRLIPRRYHGAAVVEGRIYVFGGESVTWIRPDQRNESAVEIYELSSGRISQGARMPTPRAHAAVVAFKGRIYVIGGVRIDHNASLQTGLVEIYDPATDRWSTGPAMPTARECGAAVVGEFIFVPGGYRARAAVDRVEFLVPGENAWKQLPALCKPVSACSVAFLGSHLFLFGNFAAEGDVVAYDLQTRASAVIRPGYLPARHTAAVAHEGRIYVVGGNLASGLTFPRDDIQVFAPPAP